MKTPDKVKEQIVKLHLIDGLSIRIIAERKGISTPTISKILKEHRARVAAQTPHDSAGKTHAGR